MYSSYSSLSRREKMVYKSIMKRVPGASNDADFYYIDFEDGSYLSVDGIREIINLYDSINDEIERYIENNELDDVDDEKEIKSHFEEYDKKGFFYLCQAAMKPLEDFALNVYGNYIVVESE